MYLYLYVCVCGERKERGSGVWLTLRGKWAEPLKDMSSGREEDTHNRGARQREERRTEERAERRP